MQLISDSLTNASSVDLHTYNANWTYWQATRPFTVTSSGTGPNNLSGNHCGAFRSDYISGANDQWAQGTVAVAGTSTSTWSGLMVRGTSGSSGSGYWLGVEYTGTQQAFQVTCRLNGANLTPLKGLTGITINAGDVFYFSVQGSSPPSLVVKQNGTVLWSGTDSSNSVLSGSPGIYGYGVAANPPYMTTWTSGNLTATDPLTRTVTTGLLAYSANWTYFTTANEVDPDIQVTANGAQGTTSTPVGAYYNGVSFPGNQFAQAQVKSVNAFFNGVAVRCSNTGTGGCCYYALVSGASGATTVTVGKLDFDVSTTLIFFSFPFVDGDIINLSAFGTSPTYLTVQKNGTTISQVADTDANIVTGQPGILFVGGTTGFVNNWYGDYQVSLPPAVPYLPTNFYSQFFTQDILLVT